MRHIWRGYHPGPSGVCSTQTIEFPFWNPSPVAIKVNGRDWETTRLSANAAQGETAYSLEFFSLKAKMVKKKTVFVFALIFIHCYRNYSKKKIKMSHTIKSN